MGRIAEEVIAHLVGTEGAVVNVTLEISADVPDGASEQIVRIVTENELRSRGVEKEKGRP